MKLGDLKVKIFADGADLQGMVELYHNPLIKGFTTNPTLMKKAGISDYKSFALDVLAAIPNRPISFEVFADEFDEIERQAHEIASWGENVFVKIPVTNTRGESSSNLIRRLAQAQIQQNVTAVFTPKQVKEVTDALANGPKSYISVFAGRIADAGIDPIPVIQDTLTIMKTVPQLELIWASPRELLNILQADEIGCHIITVTHNILSNLSRIGKNLDQYSLETVQMFYNDGQSAGYSL